jgi:hypothetical protein
MWVMMDPDMKRNFKVTDPEYKLKLRMNNSFEYESNLRGHRKLYTAYNKEMTIVIPK